MLRSTRAVTTSRCSLIGTGAISPKLFGRDDIDVVGTIRNDLEAVDSELTREHVVGDQRMQVA